MNLNDALLWGIIAAALLFIWHCPIFKPYFGFRRPRS